MKSLVFSALVAMAASTPAEIVAQTVAAIAPPEAARENSTQRRLAAPPGRSAEVAFPDGTVLVVGSAGEARVERYAWDRATGVGILRLALAPGVYSLSAGALGRVDAIEATVAGARIMVGAGAAVIAVAQDGTARVYLTVGGRVRVVALGGEETLYRPGFVSEAAPGVAPTTARRIAPGPLAADRAALAAPRRFETFAAGPAQSRSGGAAGGSVAASEEPDDRAGVAAREIELAREEASGGGGNNGGTTGGNGDGFVAPDIERASIDVALALAPGFGFPGAETPDVSGETGSFSDDDSDFFTLATGFGLVQSGTGDASRLDRRSRAVGPSANRVFGARGFSEPISATTPALLREDESAEFPEGGSPSTALITTSADVGAPLSYLFGENAQLLLDSNTIPFESTGLVVVTKLPGASAVVERDAQPQNPFALATAASLQVGFRSIPIAAAFLNADDFENAAVFGDPSDDTFINLDALDVVSPNDVVLNLEPLDFPDDFDADRLSGIKLENILEGRFARRGKNGDLTVFGDEGAFSQLVLRAPDNFLAVEISENTPPSDQSLAAPTGAVFFFAAGDVDGAFAPPEALRLDRFVVTPGLSGLDTLSDAAGAPPGSRAFLPLESAFGARDAIGNTLDPGIGLVDNGALLAYRPAASGAFDGAPSRPGYADGQMIAQFLHADFGLEGAGATQRSTLSVTLGAVERQRVIPTAQTPADESGAFDGFLTAHTFGSSRDNAAGGGRGPASVFWSSPQASTAVGGGNPALVDAEGARLAGTPGYLVVENFDPTDEDPRLRGATGLRLGADEPEQAIASLRLLSATGSFGGAPGPEATHSGFPPVDFAGRSVATRLEGFAATLSEFETATGAIGVAFADAFDAGRFDANLAVATEPATNRVAATLRLSDPVGVARTRALGGVGAGGAHDASAYLDRRAFAARTGPDASGGGTALVSADLVARATGDDGDREVPGLGDAEVSPHLVWGLFLGDRIWDEDGALREHVHLGAWVAGEPVTRDRYQEFTGTAAYEGRAIGAAYDGRTVSAVAGTFENKWDFGAGKGNFALDIDGRSYAGETRFKETRGFVGALSGGDRAGRIDGDFFGPITGEAAERSPAAVAGQFGIANEPGGATYRASGVFGGDKR